MTVWNNQFFYKRFVFKAFPFKQIDTSAEIKPTHEEIQNFKQTLNKMGTSNDDSSDDEKLDEILKDALMTGGSAIYAKGDKIAVNKGEFTGIKGTVVSLEDAHITFTAIGIP